jgi:hypothetical protein
MSHTLRRIAWITALAAIPNGLYAVDGVDLIDQRSAARGQVTPGDAPGFPVTISRPGSYRLSGNLTVPDMLTTAIEITADNVTLDLNGFTIRGPNVCTPNPTTCHHTGGGGVGVHAGSFSPGVVAPDGVKVMNGSVRGMGGHGVRLMGGGTSVQNVHASENGGPGIVVGEGSVIDSFAMVNGGSGIIGAIVRGNIAAHNRSAGIFLRGPGGVASGNIARSNAGNGIDATCAGAILGNSVVTNQPVNIRLQGSGACVLADNAQQ